MGNAPCEKISQLKKLNYVEEANSVRREFYEYIKKRYGLSDWRRLNKMWLGKMELGEAVELTFPYKNKTFDMEKVLALDEYVRKDGGMLERKHSHGDKLASKSNHDWIEIIYGNNRIAAYSRKYCDAVDLYITLNDLPYDHQMLGILDEVVKLFKD